MVLANVKSAVSQRAILVFLAPSLIHFIIKLISTNKTLLFLIILLTFKKFQLFLLHENVILKLNLIILLKEVLSLVRINLNNTFLF